MVSTYGSIHQHAASSLLALSTRSNCKPCVTGAAHPAVLGMLGSSSRFLRSAHGKARARRDFVGLFICGSRPSTTALRAFALSFDYGAARLRSVLRLRRCAFAQDDTLPLTSPAVLRLRRCAPSLCPSTTALCAFAQDDGAGARRGFRLLVRLRMRRRRLPARVRPRANRLRLRNRRHRHRLRRRGAIPASACCRSRPRSLCA